MSTLAARSGATLSGLSARNCVARPSCIGTRCVAPLRFGSNRHTAAALRPMAHASPLIPTPNRVASPSALLSKAIMTIAALYCRLSVLMSVMQAPTSPLQHLLGQALSNTYNFLANNDVAKAAAVKIATAVAPAPAFAARAALPAEWHVVSSAAEWFDINRQATEDGVLLATVFVSDAAVAQRGQALEALRRAYGTGCDPAVRFVFVHVAADFVQRHRGSRARTAAPCAMPGCGAPAVSLDRVSYTAALHGLDVALSAFLPDGARVFPALLLTAGMQLRGATRWASVTRPGDMEQLLSDLSFVNKRLTATAAATMAAAARHAGRTPSAAPTAASMPAPPSPAAGNTAAPASRELALAFAA